MLHTHPGFERPPQNVTDYQNTFAERDGDLPSSTGSLCPIWDRRASSGPCNIWNSGQICCWASIFFLCQMSIFHNLCRESLMASTLQEHPLTSGSDLTTRKLKISLLRRWKIISGQLRKRTHSRTERASRRPGGLTPLETSRGVLLSPPGRFSAVYTKYFSNFVKEVLSPDTSFQDNQPKDDETNRELQDCVRTDENGK